MEKFAHRKVLVVGGTSGVGRAAAGAFVDAGAGVTIASRDADRLAATAASLGEGVPAHRAPAHRIETRVLDVTRDAAVAAFIQEHGTWDHVVISAAATPLGPAATLPMVDAYAAMDSKFWGAYRLARAIRINEGGSITFVSGYLSQRPGKASALQSAINAALEALARALAVERAPVRVNTVSPGLLRTPLWDGLPEEKRQQMYQGAAARLPVGRVGEAADVAEAILFLAGNGYSTGSTVFVDGGGRIA